MGFSVGGLCARNMGFCSGLVHDPGTIGRCIGPIQGGENYWETAVGAGLAV
jgi:hypothetical protein